METAFNIAITCTGGRSVPFYRCIDYMNRQTVKPDVWFVVDDVGDVDSALDASIDREPGSAWLIDQCQVLRAAHTWKPGGPNTLAQNLKAGIYSALSEFGPEQTTLAFIEDDDWYSPNYLEFMFSIVGEVIGEAETRYFNVATGRSQLMGNAGNRASLMSTVVRGRGIQALWSVVDAGRRTGIDAALWANARRDRLNTRRLPGFRSCGIKGMPGRAGIGVGHNETFGTDGGWSVLESWIGQDDASWYRRFSMMGAV